MKKTEKGACNRHGEYNTYLSGNSKGRDHSGDLVTDRRLMLIRS
jgi:hypothetical protein